MDSMSVSDEYYETSWVPPFEREALKIANALGINLEGVCKVVVYFVRDPLDKRVLHAKNTSTQELTRAAEELEGQRDFFRKP